MTREKLIALGEANGAGMSYDRWKEMARAIEGVTCPCLECGLVVGNDVQPCDGCGRLVCSSCWYAHGHSSAGWSPESYEHRVFAGAETLSAQGAAPPG